jgi:DHA2 family multidrug resistance protein
LAFAVLSALCGLSTSLGMLVAAAWRWVCGGPIMPLAQTLMLRLLPPEKQVLGTVIWAMTTLIGPIVGPVLGGTVRQCCWLRSSSSACRWRGGRPDADGAAARAR